MNLLQCQCYIIYNLVNLTYLLLFLKRNLASSTRYALTHWGLKITSFRFAIILTTFSVAKMKKDKKKYVKKDCMNYKVTHGCGKKN